MKDCDWWLAECPCDCYNTGLFKYSHACLEFVSTRIIYSSKVTSRFAVKMLLQ